MLRPMFVLILTMAASPGPARAEAPFLEAAHGPSGGGDPTLSCEFQRQFRIYQSDELHSGKSWPVEPRLDVCDIPVGPTYPRTRR